MHKRFCFVLFFLDYWVCAVSNRAAACCSKAMRRDPLKIPTMQQLWLPLLSAHNIQGKMQLFMLSCTDVSEGKKKKTAVLGFIHLQFSDRLQRVRMLIVISGTGFGCAINIVSLNSTSTKAKQHSLYF